MKHIVIYVGAFAALMTVLVAWTQLGWDRPAMWGEVQQAFDTLGTRVGYNEQILLGQLWERLTRRIYELEILLQSDPLNPKLIEELVRLRAQLNEVKLGLDEK